MVIEIFNKSMQALDVMRTQITFVRHGENIPYVQGEPKYPGPGLTKKGISQAKKTAKYLSDFKFNRIYCSDMTRAIETTKEIKKYQHAKATYHRELAEVSMTIYDKKPADKEKLKTNLKRINNTLKLFKKILKENNGKNILIVAHGNVIRAIIGTSLGFSLKNAPHLHMYNCSISTLVFEKGKLTGLPQLCFASHHNKKGFKENIDYYHERIAYFKDLKNRVM
jgi:phosphoserine phosphatase